MLSPEMFEWDWVTTVREQHQSKSCFCFFGWEGHILQGSEVVRAFEALWIPCPSTQHSSKKQKQNYCLDPNNKNNPKESQRWIQERSPKRPHQRPAQVKIGTEPSGSRPVASEEGHAS